MVNGIRYETKSHGIDTIKIGKKRYNVPLYNSTTKASRRSTLVGEAHVMRWGTKKTKVESVFVTPKYRKQGVALNMLNQASRHHRGTLTASTLRSNDGEALARRLQGAAAPARKNKAATAHKISARMESNFNFTPASEHRIAYKKRLKKKIRRQKRAAKGKRT
jgi:predicted GNAT family acetyltransferase